MSDAAIHPRIFERLIGTLSKQLDHAVDDLRAAQSVAVASLRAQVENLHTLSLVPGFGWAALHIPDYEAVIAGLLSIDPSSPPEAKEVEELLVQVKLLNVSMSAFCNAILSEKWTRFAQPHEDRTR